MWTERFLPWDEIIGECQRCGRRVIRRCDGLICHTGADNESTSIMCRAASFDGEKWDDNIPRHWRVKVAP